MKRRPCSLFLCSRSSILAILIVAAALVRPVSATECIDGLPDTLFNTSSNCTSEPAIDRIFGTQIMYWGGTPMLVGNIGNDLSIWNIQNNQNPVTVDESRFRVGNVGDSDYDMYNFSVCDDCRYGVANYKKGTVLFDMGTGSLPGFDEKTINFSANLVPGAFTFKHSGQQYLIASNLVDECTDGNSTLYTFNGINEATDLSYAGCVDTGGVETKIVGGFYVDGYLYLGDKNQKVYIFEVQDWGSTIALNYISQPMASYMIKDKGLAIDLEHMIAIEARYTGMHIWDISNPASPVKKSTVSGFFNRATVTWPYVFVAAKGYQQSEKTFDITSLNSPQPLDQDFWSANNAWNYPDHECAAVQGATFSPDGSVLYLSRYSLLQMADFAACGGPVAPNAQALMTPDPVFPGNWVVISNLSLGVVDRSAIWVTLGPDPEGPLIAGDSVLSATTPISRSFRIPRDVTYDTAYYAHVAVESNEFPYGGASTPDQIESKLVNIDRNPDASFSFFPESPITGDQISLTVTAEGNPANPSGGEVYEWVITPPVTTPYTDSGSAISIDLNEPGSWVIELVVHYEHSISKLGTPEIYNATATEVLDISSVFANFIYTPSHPVDIEPLYLDASSSSIAAGGSPSYSWQITGPTNYSGCPSGPTALTCTVPEDTLTAGYYTFSMTLTNTNNGDTSTKTYTGVHVIESCPAPNFTWSPTFPDIGDAITFRIEGVIEDLDSATWNFGDASCPGSGFINPVTCIPDGLYINCKLQPYNYSSSGAKNVSLIINVSGSTFGPIRRTVTVGSAGSCGTACTYDIDPASSAHTATGGRGSIAVSTQADCTWAASTPETWISITSPANGAGSGTVSFVIADNSGRERSGVINVAGEIHAVSQDGFPNWQPVDLSGAVDPDFESAEAMAVFQEHLYIGTSNEVAGSSILRSADGTSWQQVAPLGFGNNNNFAVKSLIVFNNILYAGTKNLSEGGQVWKTPDGVSWSQSGLSGFGDVLNQEISAFEVLSGDLFAGSTRADSGAQVWRTAGSFWSQVNVDGFGNPDNTAVTALLGFDGKMYAASTGFWGFRLFKKATGLSWQQVDFDGFGDNYNEKVPSMLVWNGEYVLGTMNPLSGAEIWKSSDGEFWQQTNQDGFNGNTINRAAATMVGYDSLLYAGVDNSQSGATVWSYDPATGWSQASTAGFGDQYNISMPSSAVFRDAIYVGTQNPLGLQVWRLDSFSIFKDGFESGDAGNWSTTQSLE